MYVIHKSRNIGLPATVKHTHTSTTATEWERIVGEREKKNPKYMLPFVQLFGYTSITLLEQNVNTKVFILWFSMRPNKLKAWLKRYTFFFLLINRIHIS